MHLTRCCALAATAALISATAAMAQATKVNVVDPAASRAAHVELGGRLAVQEVPPSSFFHSVTALSNSAACFQIAAPLSGKALIVRQLRVFGAVNGIMQVYTDTDCGSGDLIAENAVSTGRETVEVFDPEVAISSGGGVSLTGINGIAFVDGYSAPASVAPVAGGQTIQVRGMPRGQR